MKNRELYEKDPGEMRLLNNGVAEVTEVDTDQLRQTLRFELDTFVCKGEYQRGLVRILESFLGNLGQPEQPPVWVSGFYGCGKSHLIKMLRYLWVDHVFSDGATARGVASLSTEVHNLLTELSTRGKQFGGLHAASGKLGAGAGDSIRLAVLATIFPSAGLPKEYAQARFVIWLKQNGFYETVRSHVEAAGKQFDQELRHLYVSPHLAEGLLAADADGELRARLGALIYLIGRLPREQGADIGLRATPEALADLLVEDLQAGSAQLRNRVSDVLAEMFETGKMMKIGDEYRLQTKQSSAWVGDFEERRSRLLQNDQQIASLRGDRIKAECDRRLKDIRLLHGKCKERRSIEFHYGPEPPKPKGPVVPVWIRDGWSDSLKSVQDDAHQAGVESPTVFVFIERREAEELKQRLAELKAAEETLDVRGEPSSPEGKEARRAIQTRRATAQSHLELVQSTIFKQTRVIQGGGSEIDGGTLAEKVDTCSKYSLARLFPKFNDADDARWDQVLKKAKNGDANALESVDYPGDVAKHPVCSAILGYVGSGKKGREVRSEFAGDTYGWPQDAVDACLVLLTLTEHLQATQNEKPVVARQLDQAKIGPGKFRVESRPLTAAEKIKLRKLFQTVGIPCKPNEEALAAGKFLQELRSLAESAGGEPPLPIRPDTKHLDDLAQQSGNEQLVSILAAEDRVTKEAQDCEKAAGLAKQRTPRWDDLQLLLDHASGLTVVEEVRPQVDAIQDQRSLLGEPDPVPPLCDKLTQALRETVKQAHQKYERTHVEGMQQLVESEDWQKLPEEDRGRILRQQGLGDVPEVQVGTQQEVLDTLQKCPLSSWYDQRDALPTRFDKARMEAAKRLAPKAVSIKVPAATLRNEEDVDLWLDAVRDKIVQRLNDGPVIIS